MYDGTPGVPHFAHDGAGVSSDMRQRGQAAYSMNETIHETDPAARHESGSPVVSKGARQGSQQPRSQYPAAGLQVLGVL